ncbi:MAG: hypothetical protein K8S20_17900 [Chloroflexi bacterium]|nr:hypothetical protein [Chloroflexota bacterium]
MNKRTRLTTSLIAAVILLACACPVSGLPALGNQPTPAAPGIPATQLQAPTAVPQQIGEVIYSDDFSANSSELESFSDETGAVETRNGAYVVQSTGDLWNWGRSTSEYTDTVIEFDVTLVTGPANNNAGMGVICRLHSREDNSIDGYLLGISGDGFYSIRSISSGSMTPLVDWTSADVINQGNATNKIRATCNGSDLRLEVNGELVASASTVAGGSASGSFAFAAVSFETSEPNSEVHFDNLVISKP